MPPNKEALETIFKGRASGPVGARLMANNFNVQALRPIAPYAENAILRKDEWKQMDDAIQAITLTRMVGVNDLTSRGLTYNITNGLGTLVLEYENINDFTEADISMAADTPASRDRPDYELAYLPLPIISKDYGFNIRELQSSRTKGMTLDMTSSQIAGRKLAEKVETILFQGASTFKFGGGTIYGYTDFPSTVTGDLTAAWTASAADPVQDVINMKQASIDARHYGPWIAYIPTAYETVLDEDYTTNYPVTYRERILKLGGIQDVKVADFLTSGVLLVEMDAQTVRMVIGLQPTPVEWETMGGLVTNYKVMTIMVPQLRADQAGRCGIIYYT